MATNYQEFYTDTDCLWETKTFSDRHTLCVTHTDCLTDTDFLWQSQTSLDRHRPIMTDRHKPSVTDKGRCDKQRLYVTDTQRWWKIQSVCDRQKLYVTNTHCLCPWRTLSVSVTDTHCLWQKETACARNILNTTKHVGI